MKNIAIFLIVISHVLRALRLESNDQFSHEYLLDFTTASRSIPYFILNLFSYFGSLGNTIFFVCSAWFLLRSSQFSKRKWFGMFFEVWFVSVFILAVVFVARRGNLSAKLLIASLFPNTFSNNWYITCYLLFYPIHPLLNMVVRKLNQRQLLRITGVMFFLYCCVCFVRDGSFFASYLILWITIYFIMAYLQLYMDESVNSAGRNFALLAIGLIGYIGLTAGTDILGLHISFFKDKVLYWAVNCNPFLIAISIVLFNLMRRLDFRSKAVNYVSSLSLLIYIIHENIILRSCYRPLMWRYVYQNYGYDHIVLWVFVLAIITFLFGFVSAAIYDLTLRRAVKIVGDHIFSVIRTCWLKVETVCLGFH